MRNLFKNPLEVKDEDSLGVSVIKTATSNYIKGTLAAGAGLGVIALIGWTISKKVESEKEEDKEVLDEEVNAIEVVDYEREEESEEEETKLKVVSSKKAKTK